MIDVDVRGTVVGVWLSCAEIYNEFIYDLFSEVPAHNRRARDGKKPNRPVLRCAEDSNSNVFIKGEGSGTLQDQVLLVGECVYTYFFSHMLKLHTYVRTYI